MKKVALLLVGVLLAACSTSGPPQNVKPVLLKHFALDSLEGVRAKTGVSFDSEVSSDEQGSLRVDAAEPMTVPLFEVRDLPIEDAVLIYQADLQSESLDGKAYLEMWLRFPGRGEFFSRGLDRTVTGTMSWMTVATPFFLQKGQRPDLVRLNLVVEGKGTVWVDNVRLFRRPLPAS